MTDEADANRPLPPGQFQSPDAARTLQPDQTLPPTERRRAERSPAIEVRFKDPIAKADREAAQWRQQATSFLFGFALACLCGALAIWVLTQQ